MIENGQYMDGHVQQRGLIRPDQGRGGWRSRGVVTVWPQPSQVCPIATGAGYVSVLQGLKQAFLGVQKQQQQQSHESGDAGQSRDAATTDSRGRRKRGLQSGCLLAVGRPESGYRDVIHAMITASRALPLVTPDVAHEKSGNDRSGSAALQGAPLGWVPAVLRSEEFERGAATGGTSGALDAASSGAVRSHGRGKGRDGRHGRQAVTRVPATSLATDAAVHCRISGANHGDLVGSYAGGAHGHQRSGAAGRKGIIGVRGSGADVGIPIFIPLRAVAMDAVRARAGGSGGKPGRGERRGSAISGVVPKYDTPEVCNLGVWLCGTGSEPLAPFHGAGPVLWQDKEASAEGNTNDASGARLQHRIQALSEGITPCFTRVIDCDDDDGGAVESAGAGAGTVGGTSAGATRTADGLDDVPVSARVAHVQGIIKGFEQSVASSAGNVGNDQAQDVEGGYSHPRVHDYVVGVLSRLFGLSCIVVTVDLSRLEHVVTDVHEALEGVRQALYAVLGDSQTSPHELGEWDVSSDDVDSGAQKKDDVESERVAHACYAMLSSCYSQVLYPKFAGLSKEAKRGVLTRVVPLPVIVVGTGVDKLHSSYAHLWTREHMTHLCAEMRRTCLMYGASFLVGSCATAVASVAQTGGEGSVGATRPPGTPRRGRIGHGGVSDVTLMTRSGADRGLALDAVDKLARYVQAHVHGATTDTVLMSSGAAVGATEKDVFAPCFTDPFSTFCPLGWDSRVYLAVAYDDGGNGTMTAAFEAYDEVKVVVADESDASLKAPPMLECVKASFDVLVAEAETAKVGKVSAQRQRGTQWFDSLSTLGERHTVAECVRDAIAAAEGKDGATGWRGHRRVTSGAGASLVVGRGTSMASLLADPSYGGGPGSGVAQSMASVFAEASDAEGGAGVSGGPRPPMHGTLPPRPGARDVPLDGLKSGSTPKTAVDVEEDENVDQFFDDLLDDI